MALEQQDAKSAAMWRRVVIEGHPQMRVLQRVFKAMPANPRCKVCRSPFRGVGGRVVGVFGFRPSRKNPTLCNMCFDHLPVGGMEADIAVLFADVRGSTSIGEHSDPSTYAALMNRFYESATAVLIRHDALIDKLIGDEVGPVPSGLCRAQLRAQGGRRGPRAHSRGRLRRRRATMATSCSCGTPRHGLCRQRRRQRRRRLHRPRRHRKRRCPPAA
jgi:hypothetical protein